MIDDIFLKNLPTIDLHGYDRDSARVKVEDFIKENVIMRNNKIVIIHGIGEGIVKKSIHEVLKKSHWVEKFEIDINLCIRINIISNLCYKFNKKWK